MVRMKTVADPRVQDDLAHAAVIRDQRIRSDSECFLNDQRISLEQQGRHDHDMRGRDQPNRFFVRSTAQELDSDPSTPKSLPL